MLVRFENFTGYPDHVRDSAMDKVEHADPRIVAWTATDDGVELQLDAVAGADAEAIGEKVRLLVQETIDSYRFFKSETLEEDEGAPINDVSPFPELVETRQVAMINPGTPVYQGELARRLTVADERFRDLAWARGAAEQLYPSTVATESLATNGYLASYPQHAIFAASLHRDVDSLNEAAAMAKDGADYPMAVRKFIGEADEILSPTVCYRCFDSLRLSPNLARPLSGGRTFTGTANCHRREDKALEELSRLQTFRMREVVFFGTADFVAEHRDWWIDEFARLLRSWKLRFRIVAASDAFFSATAAQKRTYQSMRRLKYECQVLLPHSGVWLAAASFNNHEATLTKAYGLVGEGAEAGVTSGCVGFGLDRLIFGALSQFGTDSSRWPEPMREFFREDEQRLGWTV